MSTVWVLGVVPKRTGRGDDKPYSRVFQDREAMREALDDTLPFEEAAEHLVALVEANRGGRETFTFDYLMEAAPDYAIDEDMLEDDLGWLEEIWLERVPLGFKGSRRTRRL